ncbi:MAG: membrane protein insertion efficiency factor YidD [Acidobacteria bacterium]|nr:membrane protein insertion efficiency factor YidD [Acidobacteriota bacterium]MBW8895511.1 membrane protein insertion efficiency factor YidD [Acidobacteriota bacterium]
MPSIPALNPTSDRQSNAAQPGCSAHTRGDVTVAQRLALALIRVYKVLISPMFAGSCRYLPSCSDYAAEAVQRFGVVRGSMLAAARLARCHPLGGHGLDAVPADSKKTR